MAKNYIYRMDHDTGFAPHVEKKLCCLSGCKNNTIEKWAQEGSWVIGIGGNNTNKPNKLIYVMEVVKNLTYPIFKKEYPDSSKYLTPPKAGSNVLISKNFWYFGEKAICLPNGLKHIIIDRWGCKCVPDNDINKLIKYLRETHSSGIIGTPNNPDKTQAKRSC